jgi:uncharacterized protein YaaW (UPF0174 family)
MNVDQSILVFFRFFNFAVVIGIMGYLWKRFGRSYAVTAYEKEQSYLEGLTHTHTVLRQEERLIKNGIKTDNAERSVLKERLFAWREAIQKEQDVLQVKKENRTRILDERMREQVQRVSEYRLYRQIQKEAIDEIRTRLHKQYASAQMQEQVIESIMKRLDVA